MIQTIVVTSPFVDEKQNQLFYEASYNKENKKLALKIFNHRGVLKNKRTVQLNQPIADLFTAEEYLIGLNDNHHQIFFFDIRKHLKTMTMGELNVNTGMTQKMRKNNQKFTSFSYNRQQPMIYGLFDQKHIFYFRLTNFNSGSQINLADSRKSNESQSQFKGHCEIGRIYTTTDPISKIEVQYKLKKIQEPKSPKKGSIIWELSNDEIEQCLQKSRNRKQSQNNFRYEKVTYVYLLMKHKRTMRSLSVIWKNGTNKNHEVQLLKQRDMYDFYYQNNWDLNLNIKEKHINGQRMMNDAQEVELELKGGYQRTITLSGKHKIFSSQQNIFIVDPEEKKIAGIYNKEYVQFTQCETMPRSISLESTLLMLERPDFQHLKFIFYVFNYDLSQFKAFPLLVQIYNFQNLAQDQIYLKKNIEKLFTPNGLIHPHFQQKVDAFIKATEAKSQTNSPMSEKSSDEKQMMMRRQQLEKAPEVSSQQDPYLQARKLLQMFVFKDSNLLYRLVYQLCNNGANAMFGKKNFNYTIAKQRNSQGSSENSSLIQPHEEPLRKQSQEMNLFQESLKQKHKCNFDTWNQYFEQIIYKHVESLQSLCKTQNRKPERYGESVIFEEQQIDRVFSTINNAKEQLVHLSNVYKRFASLLETSQGYQNQNNAILVFYHKLVSNNLNKIHSLFLIYNLFKEGTYQHQRYEPQQAEKRLKEAIQRLMKKFEKKRQMNIQEFMDKAKQIGQLSSSSKQQLGISYLMPHEFFNSARQLIQLKAKEQYGMVLSYLLSNLGQFEETAYFYYLIREELSEIRQKEQRQRNENIFMRSNQVSAISGGSSKIQSHRNQESALFYIGFDLKQFLQGMRWVEGFSHQNGLDYFDASQQISLVKRLQKLSLQIGVQSFKLYAIQLCSRFKLSNQIIQLIDSIKIQPLTIDSSLGSYDQQDNFLEQKLTISKNFGQQQTFIIKSLINCASNSLEFKNSTTYRELLIYQVKRILLIENYMITLTNEQIDYLNYYRSYFGGYEKDIENKENQSRNQLKQPQRISVELKHYLLAYFIETCLCYSNKQCIRELQELKREFMFSVQDKEFFQSVIDQFLHHESIRTIQQY